MIQPLYTDRQRQELRRNQILMHGGIIQQYKQKLPRATIKQIKQAYYKMFIGFTSVNWAKRGTKLGTAWQKALDQMESYIKTKSKVADNPVYECLVDIHKKHRKKMSEHIMRCQGRESDVILSDRMCNIFAKHENMIVNNKSALDNVYTQYMPKQTIQEKPKKLPQSIKNILLQEYLSRQRVA